MAGNTFRYQSRMLAARMESEAFKNYDPTKLKAIGVGIGGAIIGFVLEQAVNQYENDLYEESIYKLETSNFKDSTNNIGVIATKK